MQVDVMRRGIGQGRSFAAVVAAAALAWAIPAPAAAGEAAPLPRDVQGLAACRAITADAERLACYDRETATLLSSVESGKVRVVDKEGVREVRRSLFGFDLPRVGLFGSSRKDSADERVDRIETTVAALRMTEGGKLWFRLADGAQWQTNDALGTARMPRVGDTVALEEAALGSYWVRFGKNRAMKAHRVH